MASRKKQLTREEIHALRGKFKLNLGDKSFAEWMADLNREERNWKNENFTGSPQSAKLGTEIKINWLTVEHQI